MIQEVGRAVAERIHLGMQTVDDVAKELHEKLLLRGEETKQLQFESIHVCSNTSQSFTLSTDQAIEYIQRETDETRHNVETFVSAPDLPSAKPLLQKVPLPPLSSPFFLSLTVTLSVGSRFTFHREIPPITLHRFLCPRFLDARHALPRSPPTTRIFRPNLFLLTLFDAWRRW